MANKILDERLALRLSQPQLAAELGIGLRSLQRWEADGQAPPWVGLAMQALAVKRIEAPKLDQAAAMLQRPGVPGRRPGSLANAMLFWSMADGSPIPTFNHERNLPPGTKMLCRFVSEGRTEVNFAFRTIGLDGTSPMPVYRTAPECAALALAEWPWQPWMAALGMTEAQIRGLYSPDCVQTGDYRPPQVTSDGVVVPIDRAILEADLARMHETIKATVGTGE